jgi:hypothetical protein
LPEMADTMGRTSLLPTVKCSSCGAEIEISMMGDHFCPTTPERKDAVSMRKPIVHTNWSVATSLPELSFRFKPSPPGARVNDSNTSADLLKPGRIAPPRIDPQAASKVPHLIASKPLLNSL